MHKKYLDGKITVKIYNRSFEASTHNYNIKRFPEEEVIKNYNLITEDLNSENLLTLNQVHGDEFVTADIPWDIDQNPDADGMYTSKASLTLGVQTADCVPILFFDDKGDRVAAAHLGWKSIYKELIAKIASNNFHNAVIGPSIAQASYEVDEEFRVNFINKFEFADRFFEKNNNSRYMFDISGLARELIERSNLKLIDHFNDDTYANPTLYPSNRYSFHKGEKYKGSILSTITKNF